MRWRGDTRHNHGVCPYKLSNGVLFLACWLDMCAHAGWCTSLVHCVPHVPLLCPLLLLSVLLLTVLVLTVLLLCHAADGCACL
jgi:hypothetical protein